MDETAAPRSCPFCLNLNPQAQAMPLAYSMLDDFPVAPGHTLVILGRHEGNILNTTIEEWRQVWDLVRSEAERALQTTRADGINIGVNIGSAAGQTINHAHVHIIPRLVGDQVDPSGGVRNIISQG